MSQIDMCLDLLRKLVAIPSESQNEEAHARYLEAFLRDELGMETWLQPVSGKSYNVIGRWAAPKADTNRKLMLGGHVDTVAPTPKWKTDPYTLVQQGDKLRGLGAGDMKGGLAAQLTVLKSLKQQGIVLDAEVEFVGLADEERHSIGANAYVQWANDHGMPKKETFFLMGEPHFDNIVVGATGKVLLKLETRGSSGHAATPEKGVNAIDCMTALLEAINRIWGARYQAGTAGSHCCLKIESDYPGYSLNLPEQCSCLLNKQLVAGECIEDCEKELKDLYEQYVGKGSLTITREIPSYPSYCLPEDQEDTAILRAMLKEKFGREPEIRINQSVSDGNILYNALGIPTILYGPQGVNFHTEEEYLSLTSLEQYMTELETYLKERYTSN